MDNNFTIYPTHTCFDDVIDFINYEFICKNPIDKYLIFHVIRWTKELGDHSHAFVIDTDKNEVIDHGLMFNNDRVQFRCHVPDYLAENVFKKTVCYTPLECFQLQRSTGIMGPWDKDIVKVTGDNYRKNRDKK